MSHIVIEEMLMYEDETILVCKKPAGFPVQCKGIGSPDLEHVLLNYLVKKGEAPYIGVIHRLDLPVEGILVFAKTKEAAKILNRQLQNREMEKYYLAVTCGIPDEPKGRLENELEKDGRTNLSRVVNQKSSISKTAVLEYKILKTEKELALLEIRLHSGRHHQIRVQLSYAGWPLYGDRKYNPKEKAGMGQDFPALCAYKLAFWHPFQKKKMEFQVKPSGNFPIV